MNVSPTEASGAIVLPTHSAVEKKAPSIIKAQDILSNGSTVNGAGGLRGLFVLNDDIVWAGGNKGTLICTLDGGRLWEHKGLGLKPEFDFRAVWAFNEQEICAMSAGESEKNLACIIRTQDGGKTWNEALNVKSPGIFLNAMSFWDNDHGMALSDPVEGEFILFGTKDGGKSWEKIRPHHLPPALPGEVLFAASNSCLTVQGKTNAWFATGGASVARVFHTPDQGLTWEVHETPIKPTGGNSGIFSLAFRNALEGIAVGGDHSLPLHFPGNNMIATVDGGRTWAPVNRKDLEGSYLSSVCWSADEEAKAIVVEGGPKILNAIARGPNSIWAVGPDGRVVKHCGKV